ncbi:THO complex subunit 1-like [Oscarella lobularis]|uniref:THO complex subunit 1-like n=1 Tax=Oscarella lobularis TaxID=121494 RepID=UPI0033134F4E
MASYRSSRNSLLIKVKEAIEKDALAPLKDEFASIPGSEGEKKTILDQTFRDALRAVLVSQIDAKAEAYIALSARCVQEGMCSAALPFILLGDLFDCVTLDVCERIFAYVEKNVALWTSPQLYASGKNFLLRMCNDLLRRLSRSQDTVFCGRIQLFLAQIFPLSEKSGLNLMSQFNLENVTTCADQPDLEKAAALTAARDDGMEIEEGEAVTPTHQPVDFDLYKTFWKLQDFFRDPSTCYSREQWKEFKNSTNRILEVFDSFKLDHASDGKEDEATGNVYFAKYLTSEKLFDLQLNDCKFRRQILTQFLIVFQYLTGQIKFKHASHVLTDQQSHWVKTVTERVYCLLKETPPDGETFAKTTRHILAREEMWISWKNDSCPSFVKPRLETSSEAEAKPVKSYVAKRSKKRYYPYPGSSASGHIDMGSPELTRLWNLNADNMEACSAPDRIFLPSLASFFEEAIDQSDPSAMIEDEYKLVHDSNFRWKALRLLSRLSNQYFQIQTPSTGNTAGVKAMGIYLEDVISKLAKENSIPKPTNAKPEEEPTSATS